MTSTSKALLKVIDKLKAEGVGVFIDGSNIRINVDPRQTDFLKVSPLLYLLLNKFEVSYLILIEGIPYCLMPDAESHIIYKKINGVDYKKDIVCQKCKYCRVCPGWPESRLLIERPSFIKDLPREVVFEVTAKCNLNCPLCFSTKNSQDLSLTRIKTLINECVQLGIKNVRFTGGEPTLYKHFAKALQYAKSKGRYVTVNTNATIFNNDIAQAFKNYVDNVLVSLQGFNSVSEQRLTQNAVNLQEKVRNIIRLRTTVAVVRLGTIVSQTLINNFLKYCQLVKSMGIKSWELYRPMHMADLGELKVGKKDFLKLITHIKRERAEGLDVVIANPLPFCITKNTYISQHVFLGAGFDDGHSRLVVDAEGFLKPSYLISKNLGYTIKHAWCSPFLKKIHSLNFLPKKCQNCLSIRWCKGGSRHWARVAGGSYFDKDPLMVS